MLCQNSDKAIERSHTRTRTDVCSDLDKCPKVNKITSSRVRVWGMPKSVPQNSVEQIASSRV